MQTVSQASLGTDGAEEAFTVAKRAVEKYQPTMSDEAVKKATGKTWAQWFKLLDGEGAKKLDHKGIVAIVSSKYDVGPWWQQMVTVQYERSRGLREKHEVVGGYSVSGSKTLGVDVAAAYKAWTDAKHREKWLSGATFSVRKSTPNKSLRITWSKPSSNLEVMFYPKGTNKSQVTVQHAKLADPTTATKMKTYWKAQLEKLKDALE